MIRLKPAPRPAELTPQIQSELTAEYKSNNKKSVWSKSYIKKALLAMSNNKCCYCECKLIKESNYQHIEHFYPRALYPEKVMEWENLLPSCGRCNSKKSDHDTGLEPVVHPVKDEPRQHLGYKLFQVRAKPNSVLGFLTVSVLDLNDSRLIIPRSKLCIYLKKELKRLYKYFDLCCRKNELTIIEKKDLFLWLKDLILEGTPHYDYSATAATTILNDRNYKQIKEGFKMEGIWDNNLQRLEDEVKTCALDML